MMLTESEIRSLLNQKSISDQWPWSTGDEASIDQHIQTIIAEVCQEQKLLEKTEFGHYGSGYASFVDCWLYRENDEFRYDDAKEYESFWGLVVLFSRLSPYYAVGEGVKTWERGSSSSYLPCFEFVDQLTQEATKALEQGVGQTLDRLGLIQAHRGELSDFLPDDVRVPTILSDPPYRQFDALFYWED